MVVKRRKPTDRRSAKSAPGEAPRVPRSFAMETESRQLLERVFHPWLVTRWEQNDFGVDAVVEVTAPVPDAQDRRATGKLFAVQLKSTDDAKEPKGLSVTTGHLGYWADHSLPVLLVSAHLPSSSLRGRWIDEPLRNELRDRASAHWAQGSVTVPLPEKLDRERLSAIEAIVMAFAPRRREIRPATFFGLQQRVLGAAESLAQFAERSNIRSASAAVIEAKASLHATAYVVAIAGPQRVGKSTLVNALLGVDVSPVAAFPTTAVPIVFDSGDAPTAVVCFVDGGKTTVAATSAALAPFAAQQDKDGNARDVRFVNVRLPNQTLAHGVSLVDTPGLHDASEAVRDVTEAALRSADAVVYVLDASLGAKFKIGRAEIADLEGFKAVKDRVLVVLNQCDELDEQRRGPLQSYVVEQLTRYGLLGNSVSSPMFVSGREAWLARERGATPPALFLEFQERLWGHLLTHRATGLHRLSSSTTSIIDGCRAVADMLSERTTNGVEANGIETARRICVEARDEVARVARGWHSASLGELATYIAARCEERRTALATELQRIPVDGALPTSTALAQRLGREAQEDGQAVFDYITRRTMDLAGSLRDVVGIALSESRTELGLPSVPSILIAAPPSIRPIDLSIPEAGAGLLFGLLGFFGGPVAGLASMFAGFLLGKQAGAMRRHERARADVKNQYANAQDSPYAWVHRQARERVESVCENLTAQASGRLTTFVSDAERRIETLGSPMSDVEANRVRALVADIGALRSRVEVIDRELQMLLQGGSSASGS